MVGRTLNGWSLSKSVYGLVADSPQPLNNRGEKPYGPSLTSRKSYRQLSDASTWKIENRRLTEKFGPAVKYQSESLH